MHVEIERRFLVDGRSHRPWKDASERVEDLEQWYLDPEVLAISGVDRTVLQHDRVPMIHDLSHEDRTIIEEREGWVVRIRRSGATWWLTLKGRRVGASAVELEWPIESGVGARVTQHHLGSVCKTRYHWRDEAGLVWHIDEMEGPLAGIIIAEVELDEADQVIEVPAWAGMELTHLHNWSNHSLARMQRIGDEMAAP